MDRTPPSYKSTNVRHQPVGMRAARIGLRVLSSHAPTLAAQWAERLFLTARRHERPFWEADALASATLRRVPHDGKWLPTWTWTPKGINAGIEMPKVVVLVHGWEGRGSQLSAFVPELLSRGFRVVTFDAPGHGSAPLPRASLVEHARALCSIGRAVGPVHGIVGHSVGGAATLLATRFGFHADRLALIAAPTTPAQFASMFARTLGLTPSIRDAMIARLEARYELRFEQLNVRADAQRLHVPMLVVHDREDPIVAFENGEHLANDAPNGALAPVTGLGHRAILRSPHVIAAVGRFIDDGPAPSFASTLDGELFMREMRWR